jgi:archaellum component FlaC
MATNRKMISGDPRAAAEAAEALAGSGSADAPGVDKIRELLFGNQMQDYDRRFAVIDDRFQQKMRDAEAETARSLTSLETSLKKQMESMAAQFRNDKDVLAEADKALDRGLRESIQALEKRASQTADHLGRLEREFMERLERASQDLRDEMRKRSEDLHSTIERMFSELSNVKTDRNLLAGLFVEIARCLNQDALPKASGKGTGKGGSDSR